MLVYEKLIRFRKIQRVKISNLKLAKHPTLALRKKCESLMSKNKFSYKKSPIKYDNKTSPNNACFSTLLFAIGKKRQTI